MHPCALGPSGGLLDPGKRQAGLLQPPLQHRNAVIAPELLAEENADRHAEDLVDRGLLLRILVVALTIAVEIRPIVRAGETELIDEFCHGLDLVDRQLALEKQFEDAAAVFDDFSMFLREQAADQRRRRVVDLERAANDLL